MAKTPALVKRTDFDIRDIDPSAPKRTACVLKESTIEKLPFVEGGVVDVFDLALAGRDHGGYRLILRIGKKSKVFYVNKEWRKIGEWGKRDTQATPATSIMSLSKARDEFRRITSELQLLSDDHARFSSLTIGQYLDEMYPKDRDNTPTKRGAWKPVSDGAVKIIKTGIGPWLDKKMSAANESWPLEFRDYWRKRGLKTETMRKYYTITNAMFNVCVKRKYIANNPIDGYIYLFPESKDSDRSKNIYSFEEDDILDFIFSDDTPGGPAGKLIIATMIVSGARNAEVFRNEQANFDISNKLLRIPGKISKNDTSREVPIENERFWLEVQKYNDCYHPKGSTLMFPSNKANCTHVTPMVYRETWKAVRVRYNLGDKARLYSVRATYASNLARTMSVDVVASLLGDDPTTAAKYYIKRSTEDARAGIKAAKQPVAVKTVAPSTDREDDIVHVGPMPPSVKQLYDVFISARTDSRGLGAISRANWQLFIKRVQKRVAQGKMDEDGIDWLEMAE